MLISSELQYIINNAALKAQELKSEFITIEHIFYSLLDCPAIIEIIEELGGDVNELKKETENYFGKNIQKNKKIKVPVPTLALERILQRAAVHVQSAGKNEITPEDILVAIF